MLGVPAGSACLFLAGGVATALLQAAWRRDLGWTVALGFALLLAGAAAGLPDDLLAWALAGWAACAAALATDVIARTLALRIPAAAGAALVLVTLGQQAGATLHSPPPRAAAAERIIRSTIAPVR